MAKSQLLDAILILFVGISGLETYALMDLYRTNSELAQKHNSLGYQYTLLNTSYVDLLSLYQVVSSSYSQLDALYQEIYKDYSELEQNLTSLNSTYNQLQKWNSELDQNYSRLQGLFNNLSSIYLELKLEYTQLNATHNELSQNFTELENKYENIKSAYEALNTTTYASYVSAYQNLRERVNFYSLHPKEDDKSLMTADDPAIEAKVDEITGGWFNRSDWNEYWIEVKALYEWVVHNITYRSDGLYPILPPDPNSSLVLFEEMWQYPNQTLELKQGDCEDMAVLLASMIYCYGDKQYYVECIVITGHAAVYIPLQGDKMCILDPAGNYYTNTGSPLYSITTKDVSNETHSWLSYWDTNYPSNAPYIVKWIFSAYSYEYFDNTQAFIDWFGNRF